MEGKISLRKYEEWKRQQKGNAIPRDSIVAWDSITKEGKPITHIGTVINNRFDNKNEQWRTKVKKEDGTIHDCTSIILTEIKA